MSALLMLELVREERTGTSPRATADALGRVLDSVLVAIRCDEERSQPDHDRSVFWAGALLLRRPHLLSESDERLIAAKHRRGPPSPSLATLPNAGIEILFDAVAARWRRKGTRRGAGDTIEGGYIKTHLLDDVYDPIVEKLLELDEELRAKKIRHVYHSPEHDDFEKGLWWRPSTPLYVDQLAAPDLNKLTIFACADGESDVGRPYHFGLLRSLLVERLSHHALLSHLDSEDERRVVARRIVKALAEACPAEYLGSMVRGMNAHRSRSDFVKREGHIHDVMAALIEEGRTAQGFIAKSIAIMAIALQNGGRQVRIATTHFDSDIATVVDPEDHDGANLERIHAEFPEFAELLPYAFSRSVNSVTHTERGIEVISLQGTRDVSPPGALMLGELDMFGHGFSDVGEGPQHRSRIETIRTLLEESAVIFVGTSLRDAGIRAALATAGGSYPRYAVVLPPRRLRGLPDPADPVQRLEDHFESISDVDIAELESDREIVDAPASGIRTTSTISTTAHDSRLEIALLAQRYLHLGVIPIIVDFPYQTRQVLQEVALRVLQRGAYDDYAIRIGRWWDRFARWFGYRGGDESEARSSWQPLWYERLRDIATEIGPDYIRRTVPHPDEKLMVEVWVRNPDPPARELFRWATSEGSWDRTATAPTVSLRDPGGLTQRTFRQGQPQFQSTTRGYWRSCYAMNLVLRGEPWHGLPIGVIKVFSTHEKGGLAHLARSAVAAEFEAEVTLLLAELFPSD